MEKHMAPFHNTDTFALIAGFSLGSGIACILEWKPLRLKSYPVKVLLASAAITFGVIALSLALNGAVRTLIVLLPAALVEGLFVSLVRALVNIVLRKIVEKSQSTNAS